MQREMRKQKAAEHSGSFTLSSAVAESWSCATEGANRGYISTNSPHRNPYALHLRQQLRTKRNESELNVSYPAPYFFLLLLLLLLTVQLEDTLRDLRGSLLTPKTV